MTILYEGDPGSPAEHPARILAAAVDLLRQGEDLLSTLGPDRYSQKVRVAFNGSIGGHYRHCLDHFASLLSGLEDGLVDYDHRERDVRLEADPERARDVTRNVRERLEALEPEQLHTPVWSRCDVSYVAGNSPLTRSTLGRELVYVIAHGIHHYALIAVMAQVLEIPLPAQFGVAPSTLEHQRSLATDGVRT